VLKLCARSPDFRGGGCDGASWESAHSRKGETIVYFSHSRFRPPCRRPDGVPRFQTFKSSREPAERNTTIPCMQVLGKPEGAIDPERKAKV
jgi:hypothetical protein